MLFNSWEFAAFLAVVLPLYYALPHRGQNALLLVASYFFYGWWDWRFLTLIWITTVVDFYVAIRVEEAKDALAKKRWMLVSLASNLTILGFFKYFNFFAESAAVGLGALGLEAHAPTLRILLPAGISFYTFQEMAYVVDVYRGDIPARRNFLDFALFVTYFPHLVAGPIQVPKVLLPQIEKPRRVRWDQVTSGAVLILVGLARKVLIADTVAGTVNGVFSNPGAASSAEILRAIFLFGIQIYGDFSGYTDIARGVSRLLGIELLENFNHPYFATNITDFWRRWHISLSSWLRDYLYIPLGGNRGPRWFVYRNLMLTMLLGGLWHGAAWTFVVWGGIHGAALSVHKLWSERRAARAGGALVPPPGLLARAGAWAATMIVVWIAWVFFRASSFGVAFQMLRALVVWRGAMSPPLVVLPAAVTAALLFLDVPQARARDHVVMLRWPWLLRGVAWAAIVLAMLMFRTGENVPFIYFQF